MNGCITTDEHYQIDEIIPETESVYNRQGGRESYLQRKIRIRTAMDRKLHCWILAQSATLHAA